MSLWGSSHSKDRWVAASSSREPLPASGEQQSGDPQFYSCKEVNSVNNQRELRSRTSVSEGSDENAVLASTLTAGCRRRSSNPSQGVPAPRNCETVASWFILFFSFNTLVRLHYRLTSRFLLQKVWPKIDFLFFLGDLLLFFCSCRNFILDLTKLTFLQIAHFSQESMARDAFRIATWAVLLTLLPVKQPQLVKIYKNICLSLWIAIRAYSKYMQSW